MNISKLAKHFNTKLAQVANKTYANLIKLNNLAQALPLDPYDQKDKGLIESLKDFAKSVAVLADKAYRTGVSASEMGFSLRNIHGKLSLLMVNPALDDVSSRELAEVKSVLSLINPIEIPVQMKALKKEVEPTGQSWALPELTPEMKAVVTKLVDDGTIKHPSAVVNWEDLDLVQQKMPNATQEQLEEVVRELVEKGKAHDPSMVVEW
jgi:hypothetical protein